MTSPETKTRRYPVQFGNVTIGDGSASVRVTIARDHLIVTDAEDLFCGRRLQAKIGTGDQNENPAQMHLIDDLQYEIEATFESKGFSVKPKTLAATLNVLLSDLNDKIDTLGHFAKRAGKLDVQEVAPLGEED